MKRLLLVLSLVMALFLTAPAFASGNPVIDSVEELFKEIFIEDNGTGDGKKGTDAGKDTEPVAAGDKKDVKSVDLVIILDKSGSMYGLTKDTIGGFNSLLDEQRKKDVPVKVSVGMFNQALDAKYDRVDINEVKNLTEVDYVPQGTTALLDAVGNTLSALKEREEVNSKGNKVLVVIITDGMENASKEWTKDSVKKLVAGLQDDKGYEFAFLGANIDAVSVAGGIGIKEGGAVKYKNTSAGVQANFRAVSTMVDSVAEGESVSDSVKWRKKIIEDKQ